MDWPGDYHQFRPHQGAVGALLAEGIPHQIQFVHPGAGNHPASHEKEVTAQYFRVSLFQIHGHQGNALPIIQFDRTFLRLGQRPAAAQQAGLRRVGRVSGSMVFVKRNEHMNGVAGIRVEIGRLDVIIGPQKSPPDQQIDIFK